ncbi:MAG: glycosyltransferase [Candidatus Omnitrophota bacterium]
MTAKRLLDKSLVDFVKKILACICNWSFGFFCINAYIIRRLRKPRQVFGNRKKILHVTCSFDVGGTQRQIINLCTNNNSNFFYHDAIEIFPESNYLFRKDMYLDRDRYVKGNIFSRKLGEYTLLSSFRSLQMIEIYKLVCDFRAERPDVVIGWGHEVAMLSFVAASIARIPKIIFCIRTFNPSYGWTTIGSTIKRAHNRMMPYLNGIVVNSSILQDDYSKWLNIKKDMICVCPNGIDIPFFTQEEKFLKRNRIRNQLGISDDAIVIINIGRFSKEKGQMILARAYHRLLEKYPNKKIYCLLGGDGHTQQIVENYINTNNLTKFLILGRISEVNQYLSASDIFVMASDFEGMPNSMMEAMASGLPCVSTNRTGALDVARDDHEAIYIDVGSVEQLTDKLAYLIDRPDERQRIGKNAQERLKEFSIEKMVNRFNNYLEEVLK